MVKPCWTAVAAGVVLGLACAGAAPLITKGCQQYYKRQEPFFACPVPTVFNLVHIRNDHYGEGAFGASRNGRRVHEGIDLITPVGQPVYAAKSGRVMVSENSKGYGFFIEIQHVEGLRTRYAHLSALEVRSGDWVVKGQAIGKSGKTGNAANPHIVPHLHFEIRNKQNALNPTAHLLDPSIVIG